MSYSFINRVTDFIEMVPDISEMPVNPTIFSLKKDYDCDLCKCSKLNRGDNFDPDICVDCWTHAAKEAYEAEKEDEKNTRMLGRYGL